jgi:phosphoribosylanthranilate isomerase
MIAKVCGLTAAADVAGALAAGADLLGFLQYPGSPRHCPDLGLARAAGARAVLVGVAETVEPLRDWARQAGAGWVQPYLPAATRARALELLRADGRKVLLPWPDEPDQEPLAADLYLWETSPKASGVPGGSGQGHAMACPPPGRFLLAGGLDGSVLAERYRALPEALRGLCLGFDAASRLEAAPGRKDPGLVGSFVKTAHAMTIDEKSE